MTNANLYSQSFPVNRCNWETYFAGDFFLSSLADFCHQVLNVWQVGLPGDCAGRTGIAHQDAGSMARTEASIVTCAWLAVGLLSPKPRCQPPPGSPLLPSQPHNLALNAQPRGVHWKGYPFQDLWHFPCAESLVILHCGLFKLSYETGGRGCGGCSITLYFRNECPLLVPFQIKAQRRRCSVGGDRARRPLWSPPTPGGVGKPPLSRPCWGSVLLPEGLCAQHLLTLSLSLCGDPSLHPRPLDGAWSGRHGRGQRQKAWLQGNHHRGRLCVTS